MIMKYLTEYFLFRLTWQKRIFCMINTYFATTTMIVEEKVLHKSKVLNFSFFIPSVEAELKIRLLAAALVHGELV